MEKETYKAETLVEILTEIMKTRREICIYFEGPYYRILARGIGKVKIEYIGKDYFLTSDGLRHPIRFLTLIGPRVI